MTEISFHRVASVADLTEGEMRQVTIGAKSIALYHVGGRYYASDAFCTHGHALLTEGYIDGALVECPMHGGTFEIASGKAVGQPCVTPLAVYTVRVAGDDISVGIPTG